MVIDSSVRMQALLESSEALQHGISDLDDEEARARSLLPGWTRGHVLTHLARNADALINLVTWARTGEETPMYLSREKRAADIEAGATRPATELVADVRDSSERLLSELQALPEAAWDSRWGFTGRERGAFEIPLLRRTEVEVHHVDLDLDYTPAHWPASFVEDALEDVTVDYTERGEISGFTVVPTDRDASWPVTGGGPAVSGPAPALLAWLIGRTDGTGLQSESGSLPQLGVWR
ncbi:MAG: maleylpyruvate isomerase family mycothiol-dependent enzyme [Nocardioidaceae bacterium]